MTEGEHRLLGRTLLDQRAITASQIDEMLEALIRTMLQFKKYQVLEAVNAEIGIQLARKHKSLF